VGHMADKIINVDLLNVMFRVRKTDRLADRDWAVFTEGLTE